MSITIDIDRMKNICRVGQGSTTCRYIVAGSDGITCAKHTELRDLIDSRVEEDTFIAIGDNCEGLQ